MTNSISYAKGVELIMLHTPQSRFFQLFPELRLASTVRNTKADKVAHTLCERAGVNLTHFLGHAYDVIGEYMQRPVPPPERIVVEEGTRHVTRG